MDSQVKSHDSRRVLWSRIPTQACEEPRDTAGLFLSQHERLFHHCADRLKGISFEPIVHVNVRLPTWLVSLSLHNHAPTRFTCFFVHFLRSVVGLKSLHSVLVFSSGLQEESRRDQFRVWTTARQCHLFAHGRHRVPRIENVRDTVPGETVEVFVAKPKFISYLDGIGRAVRQLAEKHVEIGAESPP